MTTITPIHSLARILGECIVLQPDRTFGHYYLPSSSSWTFETPSIFNMVFQFLVRHNNSFYVLLSSITGIVFGYMVYEKKQGRPIRCEILCNLCSNYKSIDRFKITYWAMVTVVIILIPVSESLFKLKLLIYHNYRHIWYRWNGWTARCW